MTTAAMRLATRGSQLARTQAEWVGRRLGVPFELVVVSTSGDQRPDVPLHEVGGQGIFVKEVQEAVLSGAADAAVHSAKDLPSGTPDGLVLAAFPERRDPRDALVGSQLDDLPHGAVVGTGSVRRQAQLASLRPDLSFAQLRGNVPTRVEKARDFDAVVVAAAALDRLGLSPPVVERLNPEMLLPQVGQGALAVECRADDERARAVLAAIDDPAVRWAVSAERGFLAEMGGGCDLPVGALATREGEGHVDVLLASLDGATVLRHRERATDGDAFELGRRAASVLLTREGGQALLEGARS